MGLRCCHSNQYDITLSLKVLHMNRVVKILFSLNIVVWLHDEKCIFFVTFHYFTNNMTIKNLVSKMFINSCHQA